MSADPISTTATRVLDLFHGPLAEVRFPDVDRELLDADAAAVRDAARAVRDAEQALSAAKDALEAAQRALRERAQRALAYARIFAEARPELAAAIGAGPAPGGASLSRIGAEETPGRRRRARKDRGEATELLPDLAAE
jgi:ElaB/YqjD/DUF883 family membrane-anchored ribosome-binding protein